MATKEVESHETKLMLQKRLIHFFFIIYFRHKSTRHYGINIKMLRVLAISLLIIGFVAEARRPALYNLYQRLLSKGDNQVSNIY